MEFEDVNERVKWEARRVAVAFNLQEWSEVAPHSPALADFEGRTGSVFVDWSIERQGARLCGITVGADDAACLELVFVEAKGWRFENDRMGEVDPLYSQIMAYGLYRLGFEDEGVFAQLPPLSAHEKLELRLSLPREFWPERWFDEEENAAK